MKYLRTAKMIDYLEAATSKNVIVEIDKVILNVFKEQCKVSGHGSMKFSTKNDARLELIRDYLISLDLINGCDCD